MVVEIIINSNVKNLNKIFDYNVPTNLEKDIKIGRRVFVPFGNMKNFQEGFIIGIKEKSYYTIKDIASIQKENYIEEEKVNLAKLMARKYFCNISECIKLMLPPGTTTKNIENRVKEKSERYIRQAKKNIKIFNRQ